MNRIMRVALYERVSTEEQALRGYSIAAQVKSLEEFCKNNNYKIVDHYPDAGVSGGKSAFKRPEMARLLADVEAGRIDMVLFTKLDRWFRDIQEYFKVQEILERYHVEWKAIHEDYETATSNGRMAITIFLAIAQNEREKGSERVSAVLANKRKNKEACIGGPSTIFGYTKAKDEAGIARWVFDPETEDAVREFWRVLQEGDVSIKAAGQIANQTLGYNRPYKDWFRTFNNEMHQGNYKGVVDYCPRYITPEAWQRIKAARTNNKQPNKNRHPFSGLVPCPECGRQMAVCYSQKIGKKGPRDYYYYRCVHAEQGCTNRKTVSEMRIEKWLLANAKNRLETVIRNIEVEAAAAQKAKPNQKKLKIIDKIRRLNVVYMSGEKNDEDYLSVLADLKAQLAAAERADESAKPRNLDLLRTFLENDFEEIYSTFDREEKRILWNSVIDRIVVDGNHIVDVEFKP